MNSILLLGDECHEVEDKLVASLSNEELPAEFKIETCASNSCKDFLKRISYSRKDDLFITPIILNAEPYCHNRLNIISNTMKGKLSCIIVLNDFYAERVSDSFYVHERRLYFKKKSFLNDSYIKKILQCLSNEENVVHISYGNDDWGEARRVIKYIDEISSIAIPFASFKYDTKSLERGDSITDFMKEIQSGDLVLLIINDRYLYSEYSMQEFSGLLANSESLKGKVFPLVLDSAKEIIHDAKKVDALYTYWLNKKEAIEETISKNGGDRSGLLTSTAKIYSDILQAVLSMRSFLNDFYYLPLETYRNERFSPLFWEINQRLKQENPNYISVYKTERDMKSALAREVDDLM